MYAISIKESSVSHDVSILMTHIKREAFIWNLFPVHKNNKTAEIVMSKIVRFGVQRAEKISVITMVNKSRLGIGPKTSLSMNKEDNPAGNTNVLSSTLVK